MTDNVDTKDNADIAAPAPASVPAKSSSDDFAKTYQEVSQARQQSSTPSSWDLIGKKVLPDSVPTSADFWVPLISAVGGYLGAGSPTVGGAIGRGLTAGASAWMAQQKQAEDIKNAIATRALEQERVGIAGRELGLRESQVQRQLNAAQNVAKILGGDIAAPKITTQQSTVGLKPPTTGTPTAAGVTPPAAATPPAGLAPSAAAETPAGGLTPATQAAQDFWSTVDPESNPTVLFARAATLDSSAIAAAEDPTFMNTLKTLANEARRQANAIRDRGIVTLKPEFGGQTVQIPGFAQTQADIAATKTKAETQASKDIALQMDPKVAAAVETAKKDVEFQYMPEVTPEGAKIVSPQQPISSGLANPPPAAREDRPKNASFDNNNRLTTAIPQAPIGGGFQPVITPPGGKVTEQSETNKNIMANDSAFMKDYLEKAPKIDDALQKYYSMQNSFKLIQSGSLEDRFAGWAAFAQTFGMPDAAKAIAGGDPAAVQLIEKEAPNLILQTLSAANPRFAQSEFMTLQNKGTPEPTKQPNANFSMVTDGIASLERLKAFGRDWQQAQKEGWRSATAFWNDWSQSNPLSQFQLAARRKAGNFKGMDIPPATEWVPGSIYVVPKNIVDPKQKSALSQMDLKPGDLFRFNGPTAGVTKIPPGKQFSAYMEQE